MNAEWKGQDFDEVREHFASVKQVENITLFARKTAVYVVDEEGPGGACHEYFIVNIDNWQVLEHIKFQHGPIQENGVNGIQGIDLLLIEMHRLKGFQSGEYACPENEASLNNLMQSIMWQNARTVDRERRKVEGISKK